jgi:hypothetical protein
VVDNEKALRIAEATRALQDEGLDVSDIYAQIEGKSEERQEENTDPAATFAERYRDALNEARTPWMGDAA